MTCCTSTTIQHHNNNNFGCDESSRSMQTLDDNLKAVLQVLQTKNNNNSSLMLQCESTQTPLCESTRISHQSQRRRSLVYQRSQAKSADQSFTKKE